MEIVSLVITLIGVVSLVFGIIGGYRRGLIKSLIKIGSIIVSAMLAFIFSKVVAKALSGLTSRVGDYMPEDLMDASPAMQELVSEVGIAISAVMLFMVLYGIFMGLMAIPSHFLKKLDKKPYQPLGHKIGGMACGVVITVLALTMTFLPFGGLLDLADRATAELTVGGTLYPEEAAETISDIRNEQILPLVNNPVLGMSRTFGSVIYGGLTHINIDGKSSTLVDEVCAVCDIYSDLTPLLAVPAEEYGRVQALAVRSVADTIGNSAVLPPMMAEVLSAASRAWNENADFAGVEVPDLGAAGGLLSDAFDILKDTDAQSVREDLNQAAKLFEVLSERSAFAAFGDDADVTAIITSDGLISGCVDAIYSYPRFRPFTAGLVNIAFDYTSDILGISASDLENLKLSASTLPDIDAGNTLTEGNAIEGVAVNAVAFADSMKGDDILNSDIAALGEALDFAASSRIIGGKIPMFIEAFLRSDKIADTGVFNDAAIQSLVSAGGGYKNTLLSIQKTVLMANSMASSPESAEEAIMWLTENMDAASVEVVTSIITPDMLEAYGLKRSSAEKLNSVITDYLYNLSAENELSPEKAEAESACLGYVYSLSQANTGSLFGTDIPSSDELISTFMDARLFSESVSTLVFTESGKTVDPFEIADTISSADAKAIKASLNAYEKAHIGSAEDTEAFRRNLSVLAGICGIDR